MVDMSLELFVGIVVGVVTLVGLLLFLCLSSGASVSSAGGGGGGSIIAGAAEPPAAQQQQQPPPPPPLPAVLPSGGPEKNKTIPDGPARSFAETCVAVGTAMSFEVRVFPVAFSLTAFVVVVRRLFFLSSRSLGTLALCPH